MDRVEPEPVQPKLVEPVERVLTEEGANPAALVAVEVDRAPPGGRVPGAEELGRVESQVVAVGPEMVVDDVEEHGEAAGVAGLDERLERSGTAVSALGCEGEHAVVTPAPASRKITERHELDGGDSESGQVIEARRRGVERPLGREGSDVELVENQLLPRAPPPSAVGPLEGLRIDHLARPVDVVRLKARGRVGHETLAVDAVAIPAAGTPVRHLDADPALGISLDRNGRTVVEAELDTAGGGRPEREPHAALGQNFGTEGHRMPRPGATRCGC